MPSREHLPRTDYPSRIIGIVASFASSVNPLHTHACLNTRYEGCHVVHWLVAYASEWIQAIPPMETSFSINLGCSVHLVLASEPYWTELNWTGKPTVIHEVNFSVIPRMVMPPHLFSIGWMLDKINIQWSGLTMGLKVALRLIRLLHTNSLVWHCSFMEQLWFQAIDSDKIYQRVILPLPAVCSQTRPRVFTFHYVMCTGLWEKESWRAHPMCVEFHICDAILRWNRDLTHLTRHTCRAANVVLWDISQASSFQVGRGCTCDSIRHLALSDHLPEPT